MGLLGVHREWAGFQRAGMVSRPADNSEAMRPSSHASPPGDEVDAPGLDTSLLHPPVSPVSDVAAFSGGKKCFAFPRMGKDAIPRARSPDFLTASSGPSTNHSLWSRAARRAHPVAVRRTEKTSSLSSRNHWKLIRITSLVWFPFASSNSVPFLDQAKSKISPEVNLLTWRGAPPARGCSQMLVAPVRVKRY